MTKVDEPDERTGHIRGDAAGYASDLLNRSLVEHLPQRVYLKDRTSAYTWCNARYADTLGIVPGDIAGKDDFAFFPEALARKHRADDKAVLMAGAPIELDEVTQVDGAERWCHVTRTPYHDEQGRVVGILGIVEDVTERKRVEAALREGGDKFGYVWEHSLLAKSITRPSGGLEVNRAFCDMLGYSAEELQGRSWHEISHPDDIAETERIVGDLLSGAQDQAWFTKRYLHKGGSVVWCEVSTSLRRDASGKPLYFMTSMLDITARTATEAALLESEVRYRALFDGMLEGIVYCLIIFDEDGDPIDFRALDVNPVFSRLTGLEGVTGKRLLEVLPTIRDDSPELFAALRRVARGGPSEEFEFDFKPLGRWLRISAFCPAPDHLVAVFEDITTRKLAEEASEANARLVVESQRAAAIGSYRTDFVMGRWWSSEVLDELFGIDASFDRTIASWLELIHPDDREGMERYLTEEVIGRGLPFDHEYRVVRRADGAIRWVNGLGEVALAEDGSALTLIGTIQDVTERRHAQDLLLGASRRLSMALQVAKAGIWDWNTVSGQITWTPEMYPLFGLDPVTSEASFDSWRSALHPDDRVQAENRTAEALASHSILDSDYRVVFPDGQVRWINAIGEGTYDAQGEPVRMVGVCQDITQRKQSEGEIRRLNESLERRVERRTAQLTAANEELEAFSYSVSHDLRAPLRHVSGYVNLLKRRMPESIPEKSRHYLEAITDAVHTMDALIENLLQFSRSSRVEPQRSDVDMDGLARATLERLLEMEPDRSIECIVASLPVVRGDPAMLQQVWVNLLGNAMKFTGPRARAVIEIGARDADQETVFFVRDNGVGFDMQHADKLFGVFQQLHAADEFDGTGIGLANVRRIITRHGGRTWAEAKPDEGATLFFSLPQHGASPVAEPRTIPPGRERPRDAELTLGAPSDRNPARLSTTSRMASAAARSGWTGAVAARRHTRRHAH